jgi:hypothetical protein
MLLLLLWRQLLLLFWRVEGSSGLMVVVMGVMMRGMDVGRSCCTRPVRRRRRWWN